jgi:glycosyltransferase involved in cell wall biosynthesis
LVSEAEKWWILSHALLVLYPSTVEGFGLVPFEAAAVDTPSLSYQGTALGEVLGSGMATIDSWSADAWSDRMQRLIVDASSAATCVAHVRSAAERHTWRACAERTWDALDTALALPSADPTREEGPLLSRVAPSTRRTARTLTVRAAMLRGWHAARRRLGRS